jgi:hypothetical protein
MAKPMKMGPQEVNFIPHFDEFIRETNKLFISRQDILNNSKIMNILKSSITKSNTPDMQMDHILQTLRDNGYIEFVNNRGLYRVITNFS